MLPAIHISTVVKQSRLACCLLYISARSCTPPPRTCFSFLPAACLLGLISRGDANARANGILLHARLRLMHHGCLLLLHAAPSFAPTQQTHLSLMCCLNAHLKFCRFITLRSQHVDAMCYSRAAARATHATRYCSHFVRTANEPLRQGCTQGVESCGQGGCFGSDKGCSAAQTQSLA